MEAFGYKLTFSRTTMTLQSNMAFNRNVRNKLFQFFFTLFLLSILMVKSCMKSMKIKLSSRLCKALFFFIYHHCRSYIMWHPSQSGEEFHVHYPYIYHKIDNMEPCPRDTDQPFPIQLDCSKYILDLVDADRSFLVLYTVSIRIGVYLNDWTCIGHIP